VTCASCGEANPARARFCSTCGSPLAAGRRRGVRKVVTVVVCDISGSTVLGGRLDPESLGLVMARYFDAMRAVLERHHGSVQKFIALLDHAGVLRLGAAAEQAAPLLREALALSERKGNLVARDRARDLLASRADG
jgi:class 3 adenylate cyclase